MTESRPSTPDHTLPPITRPNGKVYRPREVVTCRWENDGWDDERCGAVVLGTHDVEYAQNEADRAVKYWFDGDLVAAEPEVGWFRDGYHQSERTWIRDEVKGRAGVMFTAKYADEVK